MTQRDIIELENLDPESLESEADGQLDVIREHQNGVRTRMMSQYESQHHIIAFKKGDLVYLRIPPEDRTVLDDQRILCRVVDIPREDRYILQTKFGRLERQYHVGELNAVPTDSEGVGAELEGAPAVIIPLRAAARKNSTADRRQVSCNCKGQCDTRHCACRKGERKCTQYCHKAEWQCSNCGTIEEGTEAVIVLDTPAETRALLVADKPPQSKTRKPAQDSPSLLRITMVPRDLLGLTSHKEGLACAKSSRQIFCTFL